MVFKEKIGLITFSRNNYGSILQCFSTKSYIETIGFQCDVLEFQSSSPSFLSRLCRILKYLFKSIRYPSFAKTFYKEKTYKQKLNSNSIEKMNAFVLKELKPMKIEDIRLWNSSQYKYFITGSDQVWNVGFLFYPFRFLKFAPPKKRIALSASFGISAIPNYNKHALRDALNGFDYISVREESGLDIVKKYTNAKVCRIADPTFIYNSDEWRKFACDVYLLKTKYIFVHFISEPSKLAVESINWISEKLNMDVVSIGYKYDIFENIKRHMFVDGTPWDYVSMIDNAGFVVTDSFHSSLFSINFNKRFIVIPRQYAVCNQSSRIIDLMKRFNLENRLIDNIDTLKNIYLENLPTETRTVLEKERTTIRDYIKKSIAGQVPQCFLDEYGKK